MARTWWPSSSLRVCLEAVGGDVEAGGEFFAAGEGVLGEPLPLEHVPGSDGGDEGGVADLGLGAGDVEKVVLGVVDLNSSRNSVGSPPVAVAQGFE